MRPLSESKALQVLNKIRSGFTSIIQRRYEHCAAPCTSCKTPGACCLDEHFVNVRITRLEAKAIDEALKSLPPEMTEKVCLRIENAIEKYDLSEPLSETYACPLFEKGIGCLVHETAKPLPCIAHACYERKEDLPPDELLAAREAEIDKLNERVYGKVAFLPIPLAVRNAKARTK
ncbi:MAG: hypothetical protein ACJ72Z_03225 [Pyrinomonadaceae bacterium]